MRFILSLRMLLLCKNLLTKIISTILSDIIQIRYKACTQAGRSTTEPIYSACNNIKLFREQPRDNVFIPSYLNPIKARWVIDQHKGNLLSYILLQVFFFFLLCSSCIILPSKNPTLQSFVSVSLSPVAEGSSCYTHPNSTTDILTPTPRTYLHIPA